MEALVFVTETVLSSVPVGMLCECVCFCTRVITLPHTHLCRKASTHKGMSTLRMKENFYRYKLNFSCFFAWENINSSQWAFVLFDKRNA